MADLPPDADELTRGAPYLGLASYDTGDADWFHGREEVAGRLAELMSEHADFHDLPLIVVGPAGAGKSSVLRAGLLPRLPGPAVVIEPTPEPLAPLKIALVELEAGTQPGAPEQRPAIVVDHFERVFTTVRDEARRREFIAELYELADSRAAHVALALRADFYDHAIRHPELATSLQYRLVVLGAMTAAQVRAAITEPARQAGRAVEDDLVRQVLADLAPAGRTAPADEGAYDPGLLPLLSHALLATWQASNGGPLTRDGYLAAGRVGHAVERSAEAAYGSLPAGGQDAARRLFARLVPVDGDAAQATPAGAVPVAELAGEGGSGQRALDAFTAAGLVTVEGDDARVAHDAVATAWPRLAGWIAGARAGLVTRRRITEAAGAWDAAGRKDGLLWRGGQLELAAEYAAAPGGRASLTRQGQEFLDASTASSAGRPLAARRRPRGLLALVALLTALVVVAALVAVAANRKRADAVAASGQAASRQLAATAQRLAASDPALATQLAVAGYDQAPTAQATAALLGASASPAGTRIADTSGVVAATAVSADGTLLAAAGADGTLNLWRVGAARRPALAASLLPADGTRPLTAVALSPSGSLLAVGGADRVIRLWNIGDPAHPVALPPLTGPKSSVATVAFSPDGKTIAAGGADDVTWLWTTDGAGHPGAPARALHGATAAVTSVAFGLGGRVLAEGSADHRVRLFNLAGGGPVLAATLAGPARPVTGVAFGDGPQALGGSAPSGAGRLSGELAASSADGTVSLWNVGYQAVTHPVAAGKGKAGKPPYRTITTASVAATAAGTLATGAASSGPASGASASGVAFSPDGREVAVAAGPAGLQAWTVASRTLAALIPAPQAVTAVAWDGDGDGRVAGASADGSVTIWSLPTPQLPAANQTSVVAYRPDGKVIAAGGTSVELWNVASGTLIVSRSTGGVTGLAFSPDSTLVAAALADGTVELMSAATLVAAGPPLRVASAPGGAAESVAFSPDGKTLAAAADDGIVKFWSLADPARPALVAKVRDAAVAARTLAYSPDGATLAVASADDAVMLWSVRDPAAPTREGHLAGLAELATGLAFTRDSRLLAVGSADRTVRLWNVGNPASPAAVGSPLAGPSGSVRAVAVSPDGSMLAIGSADGSAWLWNIATAAQPALIGTLTGPAGHVSSVAFSPSGAQLTAASTDGTLFTWDTSAAAARSAACASTGQPLTAAQWATYAPGVPYKAPCS